jgi:hypothetical protein
MKNNSKSVKHLRIKLKKTKKKLNTNSMLNNKIKKKTLKNDKMKER